MTPSYTVSFQIVLYQNGDIQLNYLETPAATAVALQDARPRVTVGVQARAGLFRNEITCITQPTERGNWPQSQQSIRIKTGEIY